MDPKKAAKILRDKLTAKPLPFNANVEFDCGGRLANGFVHEIVGEVTTQVEDLENIHL